MARNTGYVASDGCCVAVLDLETTPISPWLEDGTGRGHPLPEPGAGEASGCPGTYPVFELGTWRFTVKTKDLRLIDDLRNFAREIGPSPRSHVRFTFELVRCTEEGRLGGWAWEKERLPGV